MKTKINSPEHVTELLRNVGKVILLKRKRNKLRGWLVHPPLMALDGFKRGYDMSDYNPERANCLENLQSICDLFDDELLTRVWQ